MAKEKFAIIKLGGRQHLVHEKDILEVNRLDTEEGKAFDIEEVLLVQNGEDIKIGTPTVKGAKVKAKLLEHTKGNKVVKQTYKAKSRYRRKVGHRQALSKIEIAGISSK
jgi:large subunit ribosomal protein L21